MHYGDFTSKIDIIYRRGFRMNNALYSAIASAGIAASMVTAVIALGISVDYAIELFCIWSLVFALVLFYFSKFFIAENKIMLLCLVNIFIALFSMRIFW
jgi:hypothetical protein